MDTIDRLPSMRSYRIEDPSQPRERENVQTVWYHGGTGVVRTVVHDGSANVVTWNYTNDRNAS